MRAGPKGPSAAGFIDRFSADDEPRGSAETWERELQRQIISDGESQPGDQDLVARLVDSSEETWEARLADLMTSDGAEQSSDGALIARVVDTCLQQSAETIARRPSRLLQMRVARRALWLVAALSLMGGVGWAATAAFGPRLFSSETQPEPPPTRVSHEGRQPPALSPQGGGPPPADETPSYEERAREPAGAPERPGETRSESPVGGSRTQTAMQLFTEMKTASTSGETARFFELGRRLQGRFPNSQEAQVSRILLGRALLQSGSAAPAVKQFDAYLRRGGAMAEEALVGQARGAAQMGRAAEEIKAWRSLVERFPGSVHATGARQRIADLTRK